MATSQEVKKNHKVIDRVIPFIPEGDFFFTRGVEAFQKRKFNLALKWLKKAVEASPEEPLFYCQLSIVHTELGDFHTANQMLFDLLDTIGDSCTDCYYLIANNCAHAGFLQDAREYAQIYLDKAPEGDFKEEAESLLKFLEENVEEDETWGLEEEDEEDELLTYQEIVFEHLEHEEWEEALPLLEEMMERFPEYLAAKHEYSVALFFSGREQEALKSEQQWLEKDPQSLFCHTNLAVFYHHLQKKQKCQEHIQAIENVYPMHEQQKLRIASTLAQTGSYQAALNRFKTLPKARLQEHLSYYKWYSIAAYQSGALERAKTLWKEGCEKHPYLSQSEKPWV